jgi:hypothetical protein
MSYCCPAKTCFLDFFFFGSGTEIWTWGFMLAKQALYHNGQSTSLGLAFYK